MGLGVTAHRVRTTTLAAPHSYQGRYSYVSDLAPATLVAFVTAHGLAPVSEPGFRTCAALILPQSSAPCSSSVQM